MTDTAARLLELLASLQARRDWTGRELANRLRVTERTVRRDMDRLRSLGYPVESLTGPSGGYRLGVGKAMPPLLLDADEATAIAVGLRTVTSAGIAGLDEAAVRALVKLDHVLPTRVRSRVHALGQVAVARIAPGPLVDANLLALLATACRDRERVRFAYNARTGDQTKRLVEPHMLVNLARRWYLLAWDRDRDDWRTFRLDRVSSPLAVGARFAPREVPGGDASAYVMRSVKSAPRRFETSVVVAVPAAKLGQRFPGQVEPIDSTRCRLRLAEDDLRWLAMRLISLDEDFTVEEPAELAEVLWRIAGRLQRAT